VFAELQVAFAASLGHTALRDLRAELVAMGGEQILALLEEPQGLLDDLIGGLEAPAPSWARTTAGGSNPSRCVGID
jgi:hypothetical protein